MAEVVWTREALRWLREIHQRIAEDHPRAADKVVQSILDRTRNLANFPEMGGLLRLSEHTGLRMVLYGHYRIVYRYESPETVQIIGVYHGALDIEQYLPDGSEPDTVHEWTRISDHYPVLIGDERLASQKSSTAKERMVAVLNEQPDDSSYDELLRELAFHRMIERGVADADAGRVVSQRDVEREAAESGK